MNIIGRNQGNWK